MKTCSVCGAKYYGKSCPKGCIEGFDEPKLWREGDAAYWPFVAGGSIIHGSVTKVSYNTVFVDHHPHRMSGLYHTRAEANVALATAIRPKLKEALESVSFYQGILKELGCLETT